MSDLGRMTNGYDNGNSSGDIASDRMTEGCRLSYQSTYAIEWWIREGRGSISDGITALVKMSMSGFRVRTIQPVEDSPVMRQPSLIVLGLLALSIEAARTLIVSPSRDPRRHLRHHALANCIIVERQALRNYESMRRG